MNFPIISVLLTLPVAGAIVVALLPRQRPTLIKATAFVITLLVLALSVPLYVKFRAGVPGF